jgi:hypothetical protein
MEASAPPSRFTRPTREVHLPARFREDGYAASRLRQATPPGPGTSEDEAASDTDDLESSLIIPGPSTGSSSPAPRPDSSPSHRAVKRPAKARRARPQRPVPPLSPAASDGTDYTQASDIEHVSRRCSRQSAIQTPGSTSLTRRRPYPPKETAPSAIEEGSEIAAGKRSQSGPLTSVLSLARALCFTHSG